MRETRAQCVRVGSSALSNTNSLIRVTAKLICFQEKLHAMSELFESVSD